MILICISVCALILFLQELYLIFYSGNSNITKLKDRIILSTKYGNTAILIESPIKSNNAIIFGIHGLTNTANNFDKLKPKLIEKGYTFITYDIYGHGWSDSLKNKKNTIEILASQTSEVVNFITNKYKYNKIHFIGVSLGTMILDRYLNNYCNLNYSDSKIILVSPSGMKMNIPFAAKLSYYYPIGEIITILYGRKFLKNFFKTCYSDPKNLELSTLNFIDSHPGYLKTILSIIRYMPKKNYSYKNIKNPLVLWSSNDSITLLRKELFTNAKFIEKTGINHAEMMTNIDNDIIDFLE